MRVESSLSRDRVQLDPEQIKRVLINLIDNALEACGPAGEIVVRLSDATGGVTIEVADTGRGIPPRDREKLFLPDFTTKGRGTGPRSRDRLAHRRRSQRHHPRRRQPAAGRAVHHRAAGGVKKRRILVIDDEKAIRETLSEILTDEGYAVTAVESGEEGLRRLLDEPFDLVFLDVWLRDRDGLSLLEAANGRLRDVPVVMISGHANVETAVRAVRLGAYDFLEKPLSLERVVLTAQKAIERRDLLAEVASFRGRRESETAMLGESPRMLRLREEIARVAPTDARVLITGRERDGQGARRAADPPAVPAGASRRSSRSTAPRSRRT